MISLFDSDQPTVSRIIRDCFEGLLCSQELLGDEGCRGSGKADRRSVVENLTEDGPPEK